LSGNNITLMMGKENHLIRWIIATYIQPGG